jgi:inorganic pyrophosphatase
MKTKISLIFFLIFIISCDKKGIGDLTTFNEEGKLHSVVSVGAGTVIPYVYDLENKAFKTKIINGKEELIEFLPPPFNIGVIPSTYKNNDELIETIILSANFATGTLLKCNILGGLELRKSGKVSIKVICIPDEKSIRNINANDLKELNQAYPKMLQIIKTWYEANGYEVLSEFDNKYSLNYIKENSIR